MTKMKKKLPITEHQPLDVKCFFSFFIFDAGNSSKVKDTHRYIRRRSTQTSQNRFSLFKKTNVSRWQSIRARTSKAETSSRCWQIHFLWIRVRAGCGSSPPSPTLASHSKRVGPSSSSDHRSERQGREEVQVNKRKRKRKKESESLVKVIYDLETPSIATISIL
jgi:hypothetical protein